MRRRTMTRKSSRTLAKRFDDVYRAHQRPVHAYFYGRTGDAPLAEDLTQEVFARAWTQFNDLALLDADAQRNWLFAVAKNLFVSELRRKRVRTRRTFAAWLDLGVSESAAERWEASDLLAQLDRLIGQLPQDQRTALVMQVVGGLTSQQIGAVLERPAGTVRSLISNARRELARRLTEDEEDTHERR